mmetsp:Transcript_31014/g.98889  ORF Transcript_31014/g.98889 Transcript_31014/m.98889 type:complete len:212 (-) Transcript_31014:112-747(-)
MNSFEAITELFGVASSAMEPPAVWHFPGDEACWAGVPLDVYSDCCEQFSRWFVNPTCFDEAFTFDRCCGGHLALLKFGLFRRLRHAYDVLPSRDRPWVRLLALSFLFRLLGADGRSSRLRHGGERTEKEDRDGRARIPAACAASCGNATEGGTSSLKCHTRLQMHFSLSTPTSSLCCRHIYRSLVRVLRPTAAPRAFAWFWLKPRLPYSGG